MKKNIINFPVSIPEPTLENPYAQLDWLCEYYSKRFANKFTKIAYRRAMTAYKKFLKECNGYDNRLTESHLYYLSIHCDHFVLYNVATYWKEQEYSSNTIERRVKLLQGLFKFAAEEKLSYADSFVNPMISKGTRETLHRAVYEEEDLQFIWKVIASATEYAKRIVNGYKKTGVGLDPREKANFSETKLDALSRQRKIAPWTKWENFVWYFENILDCKPLKESKLTSSDKDESIRKKHSQFFAAMRYFGGTNGSYRRLGVTNLIGIKLLAPLAMKFCWETGLNTESLLNLKRDCFRESHPITGLPYIRYYKERSTGEKDLHTGLFDSPIAETPSPINQSTEVQMTFKQSQIIKNTFELILKLTNPLVEQAIDEDKEFLFIYQAENSTKKLPYGFVTRIDPGNFQRWAKTLLENEKKKGTENVPEIMNLGRFRPTKITQMVREGRDFFEIQAIAGHSSPGTTMSYIDSYRIAPQARREVSNILKRIHVNAEEFKENPKPYANRDSQNQSNVIYKGVFCDCRNVYDPPNFVKQLPTYKKGNPCTYFNMCLGCSNILITKKHLPVLIAYKNEIEVSLSNNLAGAPNSTHYEKDLSIIEGVLLEYDEDEIRWAKEIAECSDYYIDSVTYQPIINER